MDTLTLDFETFYDDVYSLSKMTTEAYIRDLRFETILVSVKWNDTPAFWLLPERFLHFVNDEVDWPDTGLICHHSHFDGFILSHHYDKVPAMHIDTLSMARVLDGPKAGNSLHDLCIRHGVGAKGDFVTFAKGKHLADFTRDELVQYGQYCCNDTERTYDLANIFLPQLPESELRLIDLTVRMFTEPVFVGDTEKLRDAVASERQRKTELLQRIGLTCSECAGDGVLAELIGPPVLCPKCNGTGVNAKPIGSSDQFANLLRAQGVEPEMKLNNAGDSYIYAFAKTDSAMQALLEHEDESVRFLAEARIGIKSNIIETRAQRFLHCAERGPMPVYINHGGAHTLRPSGGDGMNWLNMSNDNANRPELSVLKASIQAPPGHLIVAADSGQGEARITAWLADQQDLVEAFAQGRDVYSEHAGTIYGRPINRKKVKEDYVPGQLGKVSILGMGFGMGYLKAGTELLKGMLGAPPIQFKVEDMELLSVDPSRFLNSPKKLDAINAIPSRLEFNDRVIHFIVTEALVQRYRKRMERIVAYWDKMEEVINAMILGREIAFGAQGVMHTIKEAIILPNGMQLNYRGLERNNDGEATYFDGRKRTKLYGALLVENTVQCLHRLIVAEQMLEISDAGIKVASWPYDEVVAVVPTDAAPVALEFMLQAMKKTPAWATGLPLSGEGGIGSTLLEAK